MSQTSPLPDDLDELDPFHRELEDFLYPETKHPPIEDIVDPPYCDRQFSGGERCCGQCSFCKQIR